MSFCFSFGSYDSFFLWMIEFSYALSWPSGQEWLILPSIFLASLPWDGEYWVLRKVYVGGEGGNSARILSTRVRSLRRVRR